MRIANHLRSHAVAYLALFFALGGTSMAAVQALPRNSVGTKQLKRNAVIGSKVKNNSLTGADIRESTLGKVPAAFRADNATHANSADSAGSANTANSAASSANATNATNATNAATAANANALNGYAANALTRLSAIHITDDVDNWDGSAITDTRAITAPTKGLLLITYSFDGDKDFDATGTGVGYVSFDPLLDGTEIGETAWLSFNFDIAGDAKGLTFQRVVTVNAGSHTVSVAAAGPGGAQLVYIYDRSLSVQFIPFDGTGAVPAVAAAAHSSLGVPQRPQH